MTANLFEKRPLKQIIKFMASGFLPGLIASDVPASVSKVFLGQPPLKMVEQSLMRHLQSLWPWVASRRKLREEGNREYWELDHATCDPEIMLRWSQTFYVRRAVYGDVLEKGLAFVKQRTDSGHTMAEPSEAMKDALRVIRGTMVGDRWEYEKLRMTHALQHADFPGRRELDRKLVFSTAHYLAARRYLEEDEIVKTYAGAVDLERRAKQYFPMDRVEAHLEKLLSLYITTPGKLKAQLDKREQKSLTKQQAGDYLRPGYVQQYRPWEIVQLYKYNSQQRIQEESSYHRALWSHLFARMACHPGHLLHIGGEVGGMIPPLALMEGVEMLCTSSVTPASDFIASYALADVANMGEGLWSSPDSLA